MERIADPQALEWLAERAHAEGDVTGYDASGWEASVWILHAMYETKLLPGGLTYDDLHSIERAAGAIEPVIIGEIDLEELLADAIVVGSPLGRSQRPGPGWHRLLWSELAGRLGVDPFALDMPPRSRSFPVPSWPANIRPPAEGSLDREQLLRLLDQLAALTPGHEDATCTALYAIAAVGQVEPDLYRGRLGDIPALYDDEELPGSPSNIWPDDRSWFVYTDWDLWATKVSGNEELVARLLADDELETVALHL